MKGEALMRKRHLEILGYRVVQVRKQRLRLHVVLCISVVVHVCDSAKDTRTVTIIGVLQIPHFEWNSMELSTQDAWKEYLKKNLFTELSS